MNADELARDPLVIVQIARSMFALPALQVKTMAKMPAVVSLPLAPRHVRGAVDLHGAIETLIDLRVLLGYTSLENERIALLAMLEARKADHINWVEELQRSVVENREFRLQLDPRKCAFGQWYYTYVPPADWVAATLRKFEAPHNAVHALASVVESLRRDGKTDEALQRLESTRNRELAFLLELFALFAEQVVDATREICLVVDVDGRTAAFSVDAVESIERFDASAFQELEMDVNRNDEFIQCFAKRRLDGGVVSVLNTSALLGSLTPRTVTTT